MISECCINMNWKIKTMYFSTPQTAPHFGQRLLQWLRYTSRKKKTALLFTAPKPNKKSNRDPENYCL